MWEARWSFTLSPGLVYHPPTAILFQFDPWQWKCQNLKVGYMNTKLMKLWLEWAAHTDCCWWCWYWWPWWRWRWRWRVRRGRATIWSADRQIRRLRVPTVKLDELECRPSNSLDDLTLPAQQTRTLNLVEAAKADVNTILCFSRMSALLAFEGPNGTSFGSASLFEVRILKL